MYKKKIELFVFVYWNAVSLQHTAFTQPLHSLSTAFPNNTMPVTIINQTHKEKDIAYIDNDNRMVVNLYGNRRKIAQRVMPKQRSEFVAATTLFPSLVRKPPTAVASAPAKSAMSWSQIAAKPPPAPAPPAAPKKPETPKEIKLARSAMRISTVAKKLQECDDDTARERLAEKMSEIEEDLDLSSRELFKNLDNPFEDEAPAPMNWGDYPEDPVREEERERWYVDAL